MSESEAGKSPPLDTVILGSKDSEKANYGRLHTHIITIKATWSQVAQALWKRYPNPQSKHVLSDDIFDRKLEEGKLVSKRFLTKTNRAPRWMEKFVGGAGSVAGVVEESIVDPSRRTFITYTRNINFAMLMSVEEKCVYYECPDNSQWTCCKKQAWIKCGIRGLSRAVEKFGVDRYRRNAKRAEVGLEYVLEKLFRIPLLLDTGGGGVESKGTSSSSSS